MIKTLSMHHPNRTKTPPEHLPPPSPAEYAYAQLLFERRVKRNPIKKNECCKISRSKIDQENIDAPTLNEHLNICAELNLEPETFTLQHSFINIDGHMFGLALHDEIGAGKWGEVKHCWDEWGNLLAYKSEKIPAAYTIERARNMTATSDEAAKMAGQLIASGYRLSKTSKEFFQDGLSLEETKEVWKKITVMPFIEGTDFSEHCILHDSFNVVQSLIILHGMAHAVSKLHANNILHLDIKKENFKMNENFLFTLIDFGFSRLLTNPAGIEYLGGKFGSIMPLEVLEGKYAKGTDVYALIVSLFGGMDHSPVLHHEQPQQLSKLMNTKKFSDELKIIIAQAQSSDYTLRPTAEMIRLAAYQELQNYLETPLTEKYLTFFAHAQQPMMDDHEILAQGPSIAEQYLSRLIAHDSKQAPGVAFSEFYWPKEDPDFQTRPIARNPKLTRFKPPFD